MKKNIKILEKIETNPMYDSNTSNNGGGYSQPYYRFMYKGKEGGFLDFSCGEFGSRYQLKYNGKEAIWGTMIDGREEYTNFTVEDLEFLKEVTYTFGVTPLVIGGDYDYYLLDELEEL